MKVNQKKANRIKGLFATLNKLELDHAISKENIDQLTRPEFVSFECVIGYCDIWKQFTCELNSYKMVRDTIYRVGGYVYYTNSAYGHHQPTYQELWQDPCYYDFRYIILFAREAIKSGGTSFMKYASHQVTVDMPDYLNFELIKDSDHE